MLPRTPVRVPGVSHAGLLFGVNSAKLRGEVEKLLKGGEPNSRSFGSEKSSVFEQRGEGEAMLLAAGITRLTSGVLGDLYIQKFLSVSRGKLPNGESSNMLRIGCLHAKTFLVTWHVRAYTCEDNTNMQICPSRPKCAQNFSLGFHWCRAARQRRQVLHE